MNRKCNTGCKFGCKFCIDEICYKNGECLKNIDNSKEIRNNVKKYWERLREKYNIAK